MEKEMPTARQILDDLDMFARDSLMTHHEWSDDDEKVASELIDSPIDLNDEMQVHSRITSWCDFYQRQIDLDRLAPDNPAAGDDCEITIADLIKQGRECIGQKGT